MAVRLALLSVLVTACSLWPSGISRDEAIRIALQDGPMTNPVVLDARVGRFEDLVDEDAGFGSAEEMQRQVWAVTLRGIMAACPGGPGLGGGACVPGAATKTVYIEARTGFVTAAEVRMGP
jgi:hypothetical protein